MKKILAAGFFSAAALFALPALSACSATGVVEQVKQESFLDNYEYSDISDYDGFKNYTRDLKFKGVTVKDIDKAIKDGESFVLYCGFKNCPWCNSMIAVLNDIAIQYGRDIAYLDTRKDPSWSSNMDIDDYDLFVKYFGDYLDTDSEGKKHLYVPHVFFIKDGVVVAEHPGTAPGHENASDELTGEQKETLTQTLEEGFKKVTSID